MITSEIPETWQQLEEESARILRECGFAVEVEKRVRTVRGEVEVDVFAEEVVNGRRYLILCECKHWRARVPQAVVHGFRTVVSDTGANLGYVISSAGFQAGAFAASELTNLQLTDWRQFQDAFQATWLRVHFIPTLAKRLDALATYTEPLLPAWFQSLPDLERDEFIALKDRHDALGHVLMLLSPYIRVFSNAPLPDLPLKDALRDKPEILGRIPAAITEAVAYRELFSRLVEVGDAAIAEFQEIRDRNR